MTDRSVTGPVILLGTDTPIGLAITRDLGRHGYGVIGIGRSHQALAGYSRYCRDHVVRAAGDAGLVSQICDLAKKHNAVALVAISEGDLLMLNRHRAALEEVLPVLTPQADKLAIVLDKVRCQAAAEAVGIQTPKTVQFTSMADIERDAATLTYPVVLKWADPNVVSDALHDAGLPLIKTEYAMDAAELRGNLSRYAPISAFPMVQEYCAGRGMGQMFLVDNGDVLIEFQHERLNEWPPEGGTSTLCKSVPLSEHTAIRDKSKALLKSLNWTGVAMVEYRYDADTDTYCFMEINGRFWGSLPLAIAAGVPFAAGLVTALALKRPLPDTAHYLSLTCCYWIPETKRLIRLLLKPGAIQDPFYKMDRWRSLGRYLIAPLRPSTHYFIFQFSDPMPFFSDVWGVITKIGNVILRR